MKILITTDWYLPSVNGVVASVVNLRRELNALGHDVRVLTLSSSARSFCDGGVTYIGSAGAGKIYPGARFRMAPAERLIRDIIEWGPDVVHSQCEFSTFFIARKIASELDVPLIHTYHTVYENYTHYFSPSVKWGRRGVALLSRWMTGHTDCVVAPTEKVRTLLLGYGVKRPVCVIPTGLDLARFHGGSPERSAELKRKLGIPSGDMVLLSVGRIANEKNISELLRCLSALKDSSVTLLLVGDGPSRAEIEALARKLGVEKKTVFTGMIPPSEIADYYGLGDLFVSASTSETQGLTYIEALASGTPALCRRDDCLAGVIEDGKNGWQYNSIGDFTKRAKWFAANRGERAKMSAAAALSAEKFSSKLFAKRVAALYKYEINAHGRRGRGGSAGAAA